MKDILNSLVTLALSRHLGDILEVAVLPRLLLQHVGFPAVLLPRAGKAAGHGEEGGA